MSGEDSSDSGDSVGAAAEAFPLPLEEEFRGVSKRGAGGARQGRQLPPPTFLQYIRRRRITTCITTRNMVL